MNRLPVSRNLSSCGTPASSASTKTFGVLVALAGIFVLTASSAFGQMNTAEITGQVKDPSGAAVPNAAIVATEAGTQLKFTAVSNASGEFLIAQLPVGEFKLTANVPGFKQAVQPSITVHAGDHLRLVFSLELGEQTQDVTVTGEAGLLQTESAAIKDTIEQQQVIDLPLKGREFIDLVGLSPGVTNPPAGTRGSALQQTGQTFGILGQRGGHNLYLVDGVSVTDEAFNNLGFEPIGGRHSGSQHRPDILRRGVWRKIRGDHQRHHEIRE